MVSNKLTIVYLFYIPFGEFYLKRFLDSYFRCNSIKEIILYILLKSNFGDDSYYRNLILSYNKNIKIINVENNGLDLDTYYFVSKKINSDYILFFNTKSKILSTNGIYHYKNLLKNDNLGMVSATASYESHFSSVFYKYKYIWEFNKSIKYNIDKYKLALKALFYWSVIFPKYPNPHLRTNGFIINRNIFLNININLPVKTKIEAYKLESGRNSLTTQINKMGYKVGIIDINGKLWDLNQAHLSNTFRQNNQENLLVSDNQTELYEISNKEEKEYFNTISWKM